MRRRQKSPQQPPLWFRVITGVLLPGLLILIGLHDVIAGQTLFVFGSSEFRDNVARYTLVATAARISGLATIGLGIGFGLRSLASLLRRQSLPTDRFANPLLIISLLLLLLGHWILPGQVSLTKA